MIHDLSMRRWGRNYSVSHVGPDGLQVTAAIWATPTPEVGDHLLLANTAHGGNIDGKTCYRVERVERVSNPQDMAFVDLVFAPRNGAGEP